MGKQLDPNNDLEAAMAEALASVERTEKKSTPTSKKKVVDVAEEIEVEESAAEDNNENDRDQLLRLAADFENFRKRSTRELQDARRYGAEKVLLEILPVLDNLERAIAHADGDKSPIVEGVRMVAKQFRDVLQAQGVRGFDCVGEAFDPERHEAMGQLEATEDFAAGHIVEQMLKGYFLHDRLLRPAQVLVAVTSEATNPRGGKSSGA